MAELKVYLPDDLDLRFRKTAMAIYGYGRGSLSRAATEALTAWCTEHERSEPTPRKNLQSDNSAENAIAEEPSHTELRNEEGVTRTPSSANPC